MSDDTTTLNLSKESTDHVVTMDLLSLATQFVRDTSFKVSAEEVPKLLEAVGHTANGLFPMYLELLSKVSAGEDIPSNEFDLPSISSVPEANRKELRSQLARMISEIDKLNRVGK